jgi:hypothetical protein
VRPVSPIHVEDRTTIALGLALLVAVPAALVVVDGRAPLGLGSAVAVGLALFGLSIPLLVVVAQRDGDPTLLRFLLVALAAKLAGGLARFYLISAAYGAVNDARFYDEAGRELVAALEAGRPVLVAPSLEPFGPGTKALGTITGAVYALTGRNLLSGFVTFSWLGFLGLLMVYRAFRIGLPDGDHRRYRLLLFFLPSLVFWPSSIGKDAWMQLTLGAVFLGTALLVGSRPRWSGLIWLVAGVGGAALVRPHMALAALAPLGVALVVRARSDRDAGAAARSRHGVVRYVALAVLALGAVVLLNRLGSVFGDDSGEGTAGTVTGVLDRASRITEQGNSAFEATEVSSIQDLPVATFSVLFRPFLWEATSPVKAIAGLETTLLLVLVVSSWRRLARLPAMLRTNRYLVYLAAFAVLSIVGFSRVGNEGILARQRTQFLPAVLVLLCLPDPGAGRRDRRAEESDAVSMRPLGTVSVGHAREDVEPPPGSPSAPPREPS